MWTSGGVSTSDAVQIGHQQWSVARTQCTVRSLLILGSGHLCYYCKHQATVDMGPFSVALYSLYCPNVPLRNCSLTDGWQCIGAWENIIAGTYPPFCMSWDRETWGEVSPHHPTRGSGKRRKLPQWGPGLPKMDFMHILGQKEATWNTIFSIFERWWDPPNVAGPGKTFPHFPPSRRAWSQCPVMSINMQQVFVEETPGPRLECLCYICF